MCFLPPQVYHLQEWELGKMSGPQGEVGKGLAAWPHPHPEPGDTLDVCS